jgi:hypothetical protein
MKDPPLAIMGVIGLPLSLPAAPVSSSSGVVTQPVVAASRLQPQRHCEVKLGEDIMALVRVGDLNQ